MTNRKRKPNPRRAQLKALSQTIKPQVTLGIYNSINEGIQDTYIQETGYCSMNTLPAITAATVPDKRSPAAIYLSSLAPTGRRSLRGKLQSVADMFNCPFDSMPWHELRYEHMEAIRARLQESGLAPSTISRHYVG